MDENDRAEVQKMIDDALEDLSSRFFHELESVTRTMRETAQECRNALDSAMMSRSGASIDPCKLCQKDSRMFWLRQDVWNAIETANPNVRGGQVCLACAERFAGRNLTLHDLDIQGFRNSAKHEKHKPGQVRQFIQVMISGACHQLGVPLPEGFFTAPDPVLKGIGAKLAAQTPQPHEILSSLIKEAQDFPFDLRQP